MGIDNVALRFLRYCQKDKATFGCTLTVGRQHLDISPNLISNILKTKNIYNGYCEQLLVDNLGATKVDSIDIDEYEKASHIFDLNNPVPKNLHRQYDTIIDCGTTQHIFNAPQALQNYTNMVKSGGTIVHCLPANNFMNFGFWQFSPNLFHSYYSKKRGYEDTEIFIAIDDGAKIYKVNSHNTAIIYSGKSTSLLVKTKFLGQDIVPELENIQQKIYQDIWTAPMSGNQLSKNEKENIPKYFLNMIPGVVFIRYLIGSFIKQTPKSKIKLERVNLD